MSPALLLVVRGPETGLRFELDSGRVRIGSDPTVDIVLTGLAPRHCEIQCTDGKFTFSSLTGNSACTINGVPASVAILDDGDRIRIGEIDLLFRQAQADRLPGQSLIAACSLFYLFRAMHGLDLEDQIALEAQIREIAAGELGAGQLDIFIGGTPADWAQRLDARLRDTDAPWLSVLTSQITNHAKALIQTFDYGPNHRACLLWHCETPADSEATFAALAAIAAGALDTASEITNLEIRTSLAEEEISSRTGIIGASAATQTLLRQIDKVAPRETTVLIQGESRPFVALNCAAITDTLLESELFGHEKGSFTGATEQRQGKLELAAGGTVFLDEIGEMALPLQAKMLRVLQQRECERVGGRKTITLDIRVVAATNRDLAAEVKKGSFREDLFHRLNVVSLRTPPLRERGEDIELLSNAFLARAAAAAGRSVRGFTPAALSALRAYDWPGNIRELENAIERAVVLGDLPEVQLEDLPDSILETAASSPDAAPAFHRSIHDAKRGAIVEAWQQARGDYKIAAGLLGVHPNSLLRMIRTLGLRAELG
jgi:DNA-binding NtrC family response regulator